MLPSWSALRQKSVLYRRIRQYFDQAGFLEVETPTLTPSPIPESQIELFETNAVRSRGDTHRLFLIPSPEVWMKKLLSRGSPSLYQISKCFRNNEPIDTWHRMEFSMLEWYELDADTTANIARMQELFTLAYRTMRDKNDVSHTLNFRIMTMNQAFEELAGFSLENDLQNAGCDTLNPSLEEIRAIFTQRLSERDLPSGDGNDTPDDLFHRLFISLVEEKLPADRPLILKDWPSLIPTLACSIPETPWADRWELYYRGVEIANCFTEENDMEALQRYWDDQAPKKANAIIPVKIDNNWLHSVAGKMPRCSGVALGLDRLIALIRGDKNLYGLDLFSIHDMMPDTWE